MSVAAEITEALAARGRRRRPWHTTTTFSGGDARESVKLIRFAECRGWPSLADLLLAIESFESIQEFTPKDAGQRFDRQKEARARRDPGRPTRRKSPRRNHTVNVRMQQQILAQV